MTIFPTHKTELKTKLPRHEVINRLEHNDFYVVGFDYKLIKTDKGHTLKPVREEFGPRNSYVPTVNTNIIQTGDNTTVSLSFFPYKLINIFTAIYLALAFAIQVVLIATAVNTHSFTIAHLLPTLIGGIGYLIMLIGFSFEVLSVKKQIEEHIDAEPDEPSKEEKSKLQNWYEKEREPFKFRNK